MPIYNPTNPEIWTGRKSGKNLYLHEIVKYTDLDSIVPDATSKTIAILGYACDEGVRRNQGRIGAVEGPDAIRSQLGKMPNHLNLNTKLFDMGSIQCAEGDMEETQNALSEKLAQLLKKSLFPMVLGGGHDMAYGHFQGIKKFLNGSRSIGIINFDAHFDLRNNANANNSGTPFYQIAQECKANGAGFNYLCLGIRKDANDKVLFQTANKLDVSYLENERFHLRYWKAVKQELHTFIAKVDALYMTIDLDGFSSAYAPGVSASSPMGFSPDIVLECLKVILPSQKLISMDIAEMNPKYDIDNRTAKLAASLIHYITQQIG
ncbi:formimidoylglutamase [Ulvibacterium marinum]|uniref:Formimidoylglutamase n=1 Tax=Ulvibacterium marinum TaxID=2419782 RepID=A0A3B0C4D4_9FLAO|nr:formimidoylglutamase [Ulvibacterium marinum]RKN79381.1 formimidoylglutamase [Ulvibacterium marinum]